MQEQTEKPQSVYEQIKKDYRETMEILQELNEGNRTENAEQ